MRPSVFICLLLWCLCISTAAAADNSSTSPTRTLPAESSEYLIQVDYGGGGAFVADSGANIAFRFAFWKCIVPAGENRTAQHCSTATHSNTLSTLVFTIEGNTTDVPHGFVPADVTMTVNAAGNISRTQDNSSAALAFTGNDVDSMFSTVTFSDNSAFGHVLSVNGIGLSGSGHYSVGVSGEIAEEVAVQLRLVDVGFADVEAVIVEVIPEMEQIVVLNNVSVAFTGVSFQLAFGLRVWPMFGVLKLFSNVSSIPNTTKSISNSNPYPNGVIFQVFVPQAGSYMVTIMLIKSSQNVVAQSWVLRIEDPPQAMGVLGKVECIARFPFLTLPRFALYSDTAMTTINTIYAQAELKVTRSQATYSYTAQDPTSNYLNSWATLMGANNGTAHLMETYNGIFEANGLGLDRPGSYSLTAAVIFNGVRLYATHDFVCYPHPSFEVGVVKPNRATPLLLHGVIPFGEVGFIRISSSYTCNDDIAEPFAYPPEPPLNGTAYNDTTHAVHQGDPRTLLPVKNVLSKTGVAWLLYESLLAFSSAENAFVCLQIERHPGLFVPLWSYYEQRFSEKVPVVFSFVVDSPDQCERVTTEDAAAWKTAATPYQWAAIEVDVRYGCMLTPPMNGSLSPCTCPLGHICEGHTVVQNGNAVNVGVCTCCEAWMLAVTYVSGAFVFVGVSYWLVVM